MCEEPLTELSSSYHYKKEEEMVYIDKATSGNWYYCIDADDPIVPSQVPDDLCCKWLSYVVEETKTETYETEDGGYFTDTPVGKWMLFNKDIDDLWPKLLEATTNGSLGVGIKANTPYEGGNLICVYTRNELDKEDIDRVYDALRALDIGGRLNYKPDWFTYAGISGSTWTALPGERPHRPKNYQHWKKPARKIPLT